MSEDNWSLKKKYVLITEDGYEILDEDSAMTYPENIFDIIMYADKDIETLRKKLIDDINNQLKEIGMFPADTDCRKKCKEIILSELRKVRGHINRRFGVDENAGD